MFKQSDVFPFDYDKISGKIKSKSFNIRKFNINFGYSIYLNINPNKEECRIYFVLNKGEFQPDKTRIAVNYWFPNETDNPLERKEEIFEDYLKERMVLIYTISKYNLQPIRLEVHHSLPSWNYDIDFDPNDNFDFDYWSSYAKTRNASKLQEKLKQKPFEYHTSILAQPSKRRIVTEKTGSIKNAIIKKYKISKDQYCCLCIMSPQNQIEKVLPTEGEVDLARPLHFLEIPLIVEEKNKIAEAAYVKVVFIDKFTRHYPYVFLIGPDVTPRRLYKYARDQIIQKQNGKDNESFPIVEICGLCGKKILNANDNFNEFKALAESVLLFPSNYKNSNELLLKIIEK